MKNSVIVNTHIYPLKAILHTCYFFLDRAYIFLDSDSKLDKIKIFFDPKTKISHKQLKSIKREFLNELAFSSIRQQVSDDNKSIRDFIITRALHSALPVTPPEKTEELDYKKDPLGIAIPWEKKYGKSKQNKKNTI